MVSLATVSLYPGEVDTNPVDDAVDSDVVAGGSTTGGALGVAVASYDGDSVTVTPSEAALAGTDVTYELTVSNTTDSAQSNVLVPVDLPASFTLQSGSVTPSVGTTELAAGVLTWTVPSIAAGSSETLSYTETTDAPGALESDTTTASATSDQSATPSTASASVEVIPAANLSISVSDGVDSVAPGSMDTYTITLTNQGPSSVTNATVADTLNGGFTPLFAVSSIGGTSFVDLGADQFEWTGINLASGASAAFTMMGTVSPGVVAGGAFVNVASDSAPPQEVDTNGPSHAVDSDSVVPAPQTISFTPPAQGVVGQPATLSGTGGGSGNPVVFSVDPSSDPGVCSVSGVDGTTLDYLAPGSCVIDANQAGSAGFSPAPTVMGTIAVEQAPAFTLDSPPATAAVGQAYAYTFAAGGVPAPTYSLAPGAPSWLSLDAADGALSGSPPSGTTSFTYSVIATNGVGSASAGPFTVSVSTTTDPRLADVSATLSCPNTVRVRAEAACTLTVANAGPATARFVTAGITLPFRSWRVSATPGGRWFDNAGVWLVRSLPSTRDGRLHRQLQSLESGPVAGGGDRILREPGPGPREQRVGRSRRRDPVRRDRRRPASREAPGDRLCPGAITASEQDGVDKQRVELEEGHAVLPAGGERPHLCVGTEHTSRNRTEQGQHGEVLLGVATVDRRVDQPRTTVRPEENVAPPEVPMQQCRATHGEEVAEPGDHGGHRHVETATGGELAEPGPVEGPGVEPAGGIDAAGSDPRGTATPVGDRPRCAAQRARGPGTLRARDPVLTARRPPSREGRPRPTPPLAPARLLGPRAGV